MEVKEYRVNGELHCEDGPAVVWGSYQAWYRNGVLHREGGPAYISGDCVEYWVNGVRQPDPPSSK